MLKKYKGRHEKPLENQKTEKCVKHEVDKKAVLRRKVTKIVIISFVLVVAVLLLAVVAFVNSKLNKLDYNDGKLSSDVNVELIDEDKVDVDLSGLNMDEEMLALSELDIVDEKGIINILILGTDERDFEFSDISRSDAILLLSLNTNDYTAKLVSIERAMCVPVLEGDHKGDVDLISHCFRWGGADLMMTELEECLRVKVDRYVRINLNAFIKIIDVLGGVDIELTEMEAWYINSMVEGDSVGPYLRHGFYTGDTESEVTTMVEGMNHMSGVMALSYARLRGLDSDWQRTERQRNVIQACVFALKGADLVTLNKMCNEILPMVRTNFTKAEIAALMLKAPGFLGVEFEQMTIPAEGTYDPLYGAGSGSTVYAPVFTENAKILQEFFYG